MLAQVALASAGHRAASYAEQTPTLPPAAGQQRAGTTQPQQEIKTQTHEVAHTKPPKVHRQLRVQDE